MKRIERMERSCKTCGKQTCDLRHNGCGKTVNGKLKMKFWQPKKESMEQARQSYEYAYWGAKVLLLIDKIRERMGCKRCVHDKDKPGCMVRDAHIRQNAQFKKCNFKRNRK